MKYRGLVQTDAQGVFELTTLLPGRYLNGSLYRPRHIHVKVYVIHQTKSSHNTTLF